MRTDAALTGHALIPSGEVRAGALFGHADAEGSHTPATMTVMRSA